MLVSKFVTECDETGQKFETGQAGLAVLAQGATGRWCEVLHLGTEVMARLVSEGCEVLTHEEAHDRIDASGNGWGDF